MGLCIFIDGFRNGYTTFVNMQTCNIKVMCLRPGLHYRIFQSSLNIIMAARFWMLTKCKDCLHNSQINEKLTNIMSDIFVGQELDIDCPTALNNKAKSGCCDNGQRGL